MVMSVEQHREIHESKIALNEIEVSFFLYPFKDNGSGKQTPDVSKNPSLITETARLVRESGSVPTNTTTSVGLVTNQRFFAELHDDSQTFEGAVLIDGSDGWKCAPIDRLEQNGECYGKRASLTMQTIGTTKAITSLKIGTIAGVISGTNITVTLPTGTVVTSLTPTITHTGKMIDKTTALDFSTPKTYTVTAENLTTQTYTVTVIVAV